MRRFLLLLTGLFLSISTLQAQNPGELDMTFNAGSGNYGGGANNTVSTSVLQPDGKIFIGGNFTSYNGISINRIARLNADGSLDASFNPGAGANLSVWTIAHQPDGKILIGGDFTSYNGTSINRIARLNADGSLDTSFNPGTGVDGSVLTLVLQPNGKILIGGTFRSYNGTTRDIIARLNSDGSLDASFNLGTGPNNSVFSIALQADGKILIGGAFTSYNGTSINRIARLNSDGSLDSAFNPDTGASSIVETTEIQPDGKILIGGEFTSYNGTSINRIARLNANGSLDSSFNTGTGANNLVGTIAIQPDGKILLGGNFTSYNGTTRNYFARLNANGSLDTSFNPGTGANSVVETTALQPDRKVLIGGYFTDYNGVSRLRIARIFGGEKAVDEEAPVPDVEYLEPIHAQCPVNFADLVIPTATDNVDGTILGTTDQSIFPITRPGASTITWTYTDKAGNISSQTQVITIAGLEIDASASGTPVQVGATATLSAIVTPNVAGVTVNFYLDGLFKGSALTNASGIATLSVRGLQLNVYKVTAEIESGCSESIAYLPVYDPNRNFFTGGGWINSPAGAMLANPSAIGKAHFSIVSKYKKGSNQLEGKAEFQFKAGNLNFKSTHLEAGTLVISGKTAFYRGYGTVNGFSGFKFTITAIDGKQKGGSSPDQFRIKIWGSNGVIYDNGLGADDNSEVTTTLGGGSIVIHEFKAKGNKRVSDQLITVDWNTPIETIKQKVDLISANWFDSRKIALTLDASAYDPLTPGFYELKADLVENEFFELDEPIAIQVLVQDKPEPLDISISNDMLAKDVRSGQVIGNLSTLDPADDFHTYSMDAHPDLEIQGYQLIWKGTNVPAAEMMVTVFSTDRAGQTISKEIKLNRELKPGEFFLYPNPAVNETNVMLDLDQSATVGFQVYDAIGRLVIQDQAYKEGSFTHTLKLDGLAPGMYTVQLKVGNMVMTKRLIKN